MRGCNSKQYGGAPLGSSSVGGAQNGGVEISVPHGASAAQLETLKGGSAALLKMNTFPPAPPPYTSSSTQNFTAVVGKQSGGYKSKHRKHRYKKSIGRRGRSRRFRGSRK